MTRALPRIDRFAEGLGHARARRWAEALAAYEAALRERPEHPDILFALGEAAEALGMTAAALDFYARVSRAEPEKPRASVRLSAVLVRLGRRADALTLLQDAIAATPAEASLWLAAGNLRRAEDDLANAELFFREALRLKPKFAEAMASLADALFDQHKDDEALALADRAIALKPQDAQMRLSRAFMRLTQGDLKRGWDDYEYRLRIPARAVERNHGCKAWSSGPRHGKTLLILSEQGVGDQMLFASCFAGLESDGPVIVECEPRLAPLFARSFPGIRVHAHTLRGEGARRIMDYAWLREAGGAQLSVEMGSLPRLRRARREDFPAPHAYLKPDEAEAAHWRSWLANLGPRTIGICWRSGDMSGLRALQFAPLDAWARFLGSRSETLISLQYDATPDEIAELSERCGKPIHVPPGLDQKQELDRTAALIANIGTVVSAPTAVSMLSGALSVLTLKILYDRAWTSLGEDVEPFMPSVRCIRPPRAGDWEGAFSAAASRLTR